MQVSVLAFSVVLSRLATYGEWPFDRALIRSAYASAPDC